MVVAAAALCAIAVVDVRERRIPNELLLALLALRALGALLAQVGWASQTWSFALLFQEAAWALALSGAAWGLGALWSRVSGAQALGMGDVKLLFVLGLWLLPRDQMLFWCLLASCSSVAVVFVLARNAAQQRRSRDFAAIRQASGAGAPASPLRGGVSSAKSSATPSSVCGASQGSGAGGLSFAFGPCLVIAFVVVTVLQLLVLPR